MLNYLCWILIIVASCKQFSSEAWFGIFRLAVWPSQIVPFNLSYCNDVQNRVSSFTFDLTQLATDISRHRLVYSSSINNQTLRYITWTVLLNFTSLVGQSAAISMCTSDIVRSFRFRGNIYAASLRQMSITTDTLATQFLVFPSEISVGAAFLSISRQIPNIIRQHLSCQSSV